MNDCQWDKKLKISTGGREDGHADEYHHPYEPTPYSVLERLAESGYIERESKVIDYGCGKGRVSFFLNYALGCDSIGLEYDEKICRQARQNLETFAGKKKPEFVCESAENFRVEDADCFYFFNPFPIEVLRTVLGRIIDSYYEDPRMMRLFFYYPDDEYPALLMTTEELVFADEIDCRDLFPGDNPRERILIFELETYGF